MSNPGETRRPSWLIAVALVVSGLCLVPTCIQAADGPLAIHLRDASGRMIAPFGMPAQAKAIVFVFTSVDCPIANRYAPLLRSLSDTYTPKGVVFSLVYPNPFETPDSIRQHVRSFSLPMNALLDPAHALSRLAGATVTPEAAVFSRDGLELYHGRIDDRYVSLGVERPAPTRHDLADAITAVLAGKPVTEPTSQAVGCFIADFVK